MTLNTDDEFKTDVVRQKAKCTICHVGFNFTDEQFHNLGVGWDEKTGKFADLGRWAIDPDRRQERREPWARSRRRRCATSHTPLLTCTTAAWRRLKRLSSITTRAEHPNPSLDTDMKKKLGLTAQEKKDVVAFMKALSGETKKLDELLPKLPPGPDGKSPDPRAH